MDLTQLNDYTIRSEAVCRRNDTISPRLYDEYGVKKGLRDENGNGVLAGLTNISKITSSKIVDGKKLPCDGQLWYRGYRVEDLIGSLGETELGYEKIAYLLLMGQLPDSAAAEAFRTLLGECRTLPTNFTRDVIMKAPGKDIMNSMTRGSDAGVLRRARHRHQRQQFPPAVHPADCRVPAAGRLWIPRL